MRGSDFVQGAMFSYADLEDRIPASHPLRKLKIAVNAILVSMSAEFDQRHSRIGRPSIPPERLLRAAIEYLNEGTGRGSKQESTSGFFS